MRGDVALLSYPEVVAWGVRVRDWLGEKPFTSRNCRTALVALGAPWTADGVIQQHFGKGFTQYRADVMATTGTANTIPAVRVELGGNVTANAPYVIPPEMLLAELQSRHDRHSEMVAGTNERHVRIEVDRPDEPICIIAMGDIHLGSPATNPRDVIAVAEACERRDIKVYALSIGDILDAPIKPKLIEEAWISAVSPEEEIAAAVIILDRIAQAGRLLAVNAGNHDLFSQKIAGYSHLDVVMQRLSRQVPYARYEMALSIEVVCGNVGKSRKGADAFTQTYAFELRHKFRGGGMDPAAAGTRHMRNNYRDTEIVIAGHTHSSGTREIELTGKRRHVVQLGSYKDSKKNAYDIEHGFTMQNLEPDKGIILWADHHEIEVHKTRHAIRQLEDSTLRRALPCSTGTAARGRALRTKRNRRSGAASKKKRAGR